jgi:hypothetical protein
MIIELILALEVQEKYLALPCYLILNSKTLLNEFIHYTTESDQIYSLVHKLLMIRIEEPETVELILSKVEFDDDYSDYVGIPDVILACR